VGVAAVAGLLALVLSRAESETRCGYLRSLGSLRLGPNPVAAAEVQRLLPEPLTAALRARGYHECYPHDPVGLGPYSHYRNVSMGRLLVPQKGGHTADGGYDVLIHFHGHEAVRKTLVQVARGVAYVGIDRGLNSGPYEQAFASRETFETLLGSIEKGLKAETGNARAHVRHVGLSAWSAGYGAVNEILRRHTDKVDAVVLLDGLHGRWDPVPHRGPDQPLKTTAIAPTIEFARLARAGRKKFVFTHSYIDPMEYTSTSVTADLLLVELGLRREPVEPGSYAFGQDSRADTAGFHVWSYRGKNELAHCAHIPLIAKALEVIEPAWRTPALDRNVPFTPVKRWPKPVARD
jgi:hypothetical protein